ncbi:MAG: sporulation transcriptional regulator SpoIIID [Bacilli bacterium]|nr:sporulation transcriptional regulator SpoIIID [Bacilli bacterium]
MNNKIYSRTLEEASLLLNNNLTIRDISKIIRVSKSTVHKDLHDRLKVINKDIYNEVRLILNKHIKIRHINGGIATKLKYEKLRKG